MTQPNLIKRCGPALRSLLADQRGNMMFLTAAAVVPILGLVGSGVDIGRAYMAELRLQQACDAGVLAGRRAMTGSTYDSAAIAEANKMFNFNFPTGTYNSNTIAFTSQTSGASSVSGTATAQLPSTIMKIFDVNNFNLSVNCAAKLEISNVDMMMVLDVTGSMTTVNSGDSMSRMAGLKQASMSFFDTMTTADIGDGRLRFGVVPYSSSANVGAILYAKNPDWLSDTVLLPSRSPVFRVVWGNLTTEQSEEYTDGTAVATGSWTWQNERATGENSTTCPNREPLPVLAPQTSGEPDLNRTAQYIDGNGNRITTYDTEQVYYYDNHRWRWRSSSRGCRDQTQRMEFTRTYTTTTTETPTRTFDNQYIYQDRIFDVSDAKGGSALTTDVGDYGADQVNTWGGCVMERKTEPFGPSETAPSDAYDMDVDSAPDSDDDTKWKVLMPEIAFARASHPSYTPSTTGSITVNSSSVTPNSSSNGYWQNYSRYWSAGWGACPVPAQKLTTMTSADRSTFQTYINSLQAVGGTYHDSGMVWGIRLLSADGMFADENATAPNGRPIARHIIFMTDGAMAPNFGNLTFQGYEPTMGRVGSTSDTGLRDRHNNRFLQLCAAAKAKNITVWVIGFGVTLNSELTTCASAGKAYQANNSTQLNDHFQSIARQISKLRLSQ